MSRRMPGLRSPRRPRPVLLLRKPAGQNKDATAMIQRSARTLPLAESQCCEQHHSKTKASIPPVSRKGKSCWPSTPCKSDQGSLSPSQEMSHTKHKRNGHQHFHQAGIVVVVDVTSIELSRGTVDYGPRRFCRWSQLLSRAKKG